MSFTPYHWGADCPPPLPSAQTITGLIIRNLYPDHYTLGMLEGVRIGLDTSPALSCTLDGVLYALGEIVDGALFMA